MSQLPSGAVTFLFTDIEGSTRLWEEHPVAMRQLLIQHDDLLRACIESHQGRVFKTVGDAFCAVFSDPRRGVESVLASQQWLPALSLSTRVGPLPLKVRMALHTGMVEERDGDYFGQPVNRVARLLATAHGGQVLISAAAQELVRDDLPERAELRSLGEHRLKDLLRPERIFQLLHPDLAAEFPPLRSLDNPELKHNLPRQVTSFVGREKEMADVRALLENSPLLTLTGSGGSGKTRLALQAAADLLDGPADGVWLVDLAPLTEAAAVPQAVASAIGLREEPGRSIHQTLVDHLRDRRDLVLLDNCEHLLPACAQLADSLLRTCPRLSLLATSRQALGISGETTYRVPSLSTPDPGGSLTPESLSHYEAVRLFIDRAVQAEPGFTVTNRNAPALASICQRLDGIPLAIELAAARVRSMPLEQIERRLDQRFRLLTGGSRNALPRQQTLRSLIDWSYDLLGPSEQALLSRLSVFAGGWTLEAAERVCDGDPVEAWDVLDLLTGLADKSLVAYVDQGGAARYRLLETVRQYARERLDESAGGGVEVRRRHAALFLEFARERLELLRTRGEAAALRQLDADGDNLWAALRAAESEPELQGELALAVGAWRHRSGFIQDAATVLEPSLQRALTDPETPPRLLAGLLRERAGLHLDARETVEARQLASQALDLGRASGDPQATARALNLLGQAAMQEGEYDEARAHYQAALAGFEEAGWEVEVGIARNNLGILERRDRRGSEADIAARRELAETHLQESLRLRQRLGDDRGSAETLNNLGVLAHERGDFDQAELSYREALALWTELRDAQELGVILANLGEVAQARGEALRGAHLFAASLGCLDEICSALQDTVRPLAQSAAEEAGLQDPAWADLLAHFRRLSLRERVAQVIHVESD